jgi:hypothetical protein
MKQLGECRLSPRKPKVVPDATHTGMWRVRWPDGHLSDMTNLTRAKDAVACFMETEERRQRGRQRPSEARLCVKTGVLGAPMKNAAEADATRVAPDFSAIDRRRTDNVRNDVH